MAKTKKQYSIGIDVGGTKMGAVLFDGKKVISDYVLATPIDDLEHFLIMIKALVEPLEEKAKELKVKLEGAGVGIAGVLDSSGRKMLYSPNIPIIDNIDLAEKLENFIDLPFVLDNDAKCFVRAEALSGAGREYTNIYALTIGTGIGSGWWINGEAYEGAHRGAGEVDAMIINFPSGLNLEEGFHKLMQNNPGKMSQEAIYGDPLALKTFEEFGRQLGVALSNIANIIDPEIFIIGGGVIASSNFFLPAAKKEMKLHINSTEAAKRIKVLKSKLGKQAGAIGAALLVT